MSAQTPARTLFREHATINDIANAFRWYGSDAVVNLGRGHSGFGLYVWSREYPEDGSILIKWRELLSLAFYQGEAVEVARVIVRHEETTYPIGAPFIARGGK